MRKHILFIAMAVALAACSKPVSFDTLEAARTKSKENANWNAVQFRASSPQSDWSIDAQTDSTMTADCPQGDGWASVKLIDTANPANRISLKCSTVSNAVGCMTETDFKKKSYAGADGSCQPTTKVPFPIPTLKH